MSDKTGRTFLILQDPQKSGSKYNISLNTSIRSKVCKFTCSKNSLYSGYIIHISSFLLFSNHLFRTINVHLASHTSWTNLSTTSLFVFTQGFISHSK